FLKSRRARRLKRDNPTVLLAGTLRRKSLPVGLLILISVVSFRRFSNLGRSFFMERQPTGKENRNGTQIKEKEGKAGGPKACNHGQLSAECRRAYRGIEEAT